MRAGKSLILVLVMFLGAAAWAQDPDGTPRLMQGPMLGAVGPEEALVWVRANGPHRVSIEYDVSWPFKEPRRTEEVRAREEDDWCVVLKLTGLTPRWQFHYRPLVNGKPDRYLDSEGAFSFWTAPVTTAPDNFRVMFGSCARYQQDRAQPIWDAVRQAEPRLFFWVGDNIYGDSPDPRILAEEYRRQREVLTLQPLLPSVGHLAVWDDHDYGLNNHDRRSPVKEDALNVMKQYWPNPGFGLPDTPGVFFHYRYSLVDFFFLDCRYHRDPNEQPDSPEKTFLGRQQLEWLKAGLKASDGVFKVLVSGSGFNSQKGVDGDSWSAFRHERDGLFDFIRDEQIEGVVLISGDTHVGELNCIPWSTRGGYDFYELVSSPLAQKPSQSSAVRMPEVRMRLVHTASVNAGVLDFAFGESPQVTLNLIGPDGGAVYEPLIVRADELKNGVESYTAKNPARISREFRKD